MGSFEAGRSNRYISGNRYLGKEILPIANEFNVSFLMIYKGAWLGLQRVCFTPSAEMKK
jgi:hypothetical protein